MVEAVDTNVILRFLVGDELKQHQQAVEWFEEGRKGKRKLAIKTLVVAEACFVLETHYKKSRDEIAQAFEVFLGQRWLKVEDRQVLLSLWPWYCQKLHFVDSFLLAWSQVKHGRLLTFDKQMLRQLKRY